MPLNAPVNASATKRSDQVKQRFYVKFQHDVLLVNYQIYSKSKFFFYPSDSFNNPLQSLSRGMPVHGILKTTHVTIVTVAVQHKLRGLVGKCVLLN